MSQLKVWKLVGSPPSWAVMMLGDILGLQIETKDIDFQAKEHKTLAFKKLNPMGTIPVLQDGDFIISESHTIMKYLLEKYGAEHREALYPSDIRARALVDQAMYFDTGIAFIRVKIVALPTIYSGLEGLTPELVEQIEEAYSIVEDYLGRNLYVAADHLTLADLSLGSTVIALSAMYKLDAGKFPRTAAWLAKLVKEPCFKKIAIPGSQAFGKVIHACWENNKKKQ